MTSVTSTVADTIRIQNSNNLAFLRFSQPRSLFSNPQLVGTTWNTWSSDTSVRCLLTMSVYILVAVASYANVLIFVAASLCWFNVAATRVADTSEIRGTKPKQVLLYTMTYGTSSHILNFIHLARLIQRNGSTVHLLIGSDNAHLVPRDVTEAGLVLHTYAGPREGAVTFQSEGLTSKVSTWLPGSLSVSTMQSCWQVINLRVKSSLKSFSSSPSQVSSHP